MSATPGASPPSGQRQERAPNHNRRKPTITMRASPVVSINSLLQTSRKYLPCVAFHSQLPQRPLTSTSHPPCRFHVASASFCHLLTTSGIQQRSLRHFCTCGKPCSSGCCNPCTCHFHGCESLNRWISLCFLASMWRMLGTKLSPGRQGLVPFLFVVLVERPSPIFS